MIKSMTLTSNTFRLVRVIAKNTVLPMLTCANPPSRTETQPR